MKKTLLFAFFLMATAICFGQDNSPTITFGQAWAHYAHTISYWAWIVGLIVLWGIIFAVLAHIAKTTPINPWLLIIVRFAAAATIVAAILSVPADTAVNTTVNMMAKGIYIR